MRKTAGAQQGFIIAHQSTFFVGAEFHEFYFFQKGGAFVGYNEPVAALEILPDFLSSKGGGWRDGNSFNFHIKTRGPRSQPALLRVR